MTTGNDKPKVRKPKPATDADIASLREPETGLKAGASGLKQLVMPLIIALIVCFGMLNFTGMAVSKKDFETNFINVSNTIAEMQSSITAIQTQLGTQTAQINSLNTLAGKIDTVQSSLNALQSDVSGIKTSTATDVANLVTLQASLTTLQTEVTALKTKVDNWAVGGGTGGTTTGQVTATIVGGTLPYMHTGMNIATPFFTVRITNNSNVHQWASYTMFLQNPTPLAVDTFVVGGTPALVLYCSNYQTSWASTYTGAPTTQIIITPNANKVLVSAGQYIDLNCYTQQTGVTVEQWQVTIVPVSSTTSP